MIYLLIGTAIIAITNLGTLSVIMHYIDKDMREEYQRSQKKRIQTKTKKRRRS